MPPNYGYECADCDEVFEKNVPYSERESPQICECGGLGGYTWKDMRITVSTEKLSKSIPAAAAKGRFGELREKQKLKKVIASARETGDRQVEKAAKKELNTRGKK